MLQCPFMLGTYYCSECSSLVKNKGIDQSKEDSFLDIRETKFCSFRDNDCLERLCSPQVDVYSNKTLSIVLSMPLEDSTACNSMRREIHPQRIHPLFPFTSLILGLQQIFNSQENKTICSAQSDQKSDWCESQPLSNLLK